MLRRGWKTDQPKQTTFIEPPIISLMLQDLPVEMMEHVFFQLYEDAPELLKASWVCKLHREIIYKKFGPSLLNFQTMMDDRRLHSCFSLIMCKPAICSESYGAISSFFCINVGNTSSVTTANDSTEDTNCLTNRDKSLVTNNIFTFFAEFTVNTEQPVECKNTDSRDLLKIP